MDTIVSNAGQTRTCYEEMRGAQRFTLLIRTAKLVCESGEYICIIRDVSETGVRLKLFHALPADRRMALELANGAVYFIESVWEQGGHAGFRFSAPIDVHGFIAEVSPYARRQLRLRVDFAAAVAVDGEAVEARVTDLSQNGARIECGHHLAVGQRVKLVAEGFPPVIARIAWRSSPEYGLAFEEVFTLEALAVLVAGRQGVTHVKIPQMQAAANR